MAKLSTQALKVTYRDVKTAVSVEGKNIAMIKTLKESLL